MTETFDKRTRDKCAEIARISNFVDGPKGTIEGQISDAIRALPTRGQAGVMVPRELFVELAMLIDPPPLEADGMRHVFLNPMAAEVLTKISAIVRKIIASRQASERGQEDADRTVYVIEKGSPAQYFCGFNYGVGKWTTDFFSAHQFSSREVAQQMWDCDAPIFTIYNDNCRIEGHIIFAGSAPHPASPRDVTSSRLAEIVTLCRPAVKAWANQAAMSALNAERGKYPPHYKPLLDAEAKRAADLLDEIDSIKTEEK